MSFQIAAYRARDGGRYAMLYQGKPQQGLNVYLEETFWPGFSAPRGKGTSSIAHGLAMDEAVARMLRDPTKKPPLGCARTLRHYCEDLATLHITLLETQVMTGYPPLGVATSIDDMGRDEDGVYVVIERKTGYLQRDTVSKKQPWLLPPLTEVHNRQSAHHLLQATYGRLFLQHWFPELKFRSLVCYTSQKSRALAKGDLHFEWREAKFSKEALLLSHPLAPTTAPEPQWQHQA